MVLKDDRFVLNIAGVGDDLDNMIQEASKKSERVHYHGKLQYTEALKIMNDSDFIVALYYPYMSNHVYAAPNKSYEALFLATPIITSQGTLVGDKVLKSNTGYVVDDTLEGLRSMFDDVYTEDFKKEYDGSLEVAPSNAVSSEVKPAMEVRDNVLPANSCYGFQVFTLSRQLPADDRSFKGHKATSYLSGGKFKYVIGGFATPEEARANAEKVKKDFPEAFLVKVEDGSVERFR